MDVWLNVSGWLLVFSLVVADLGVGIVAFPSGYICFIYNANCNKTIYIAAYWFLVHSSVANLCVLTWDRYTAIVHPFKYITSITVRRPGRVILFAWAIPLLISLYLSLEMYAHELTHCFKSAASTWCLWF